MALTSGTRLGPYEILSPLGAGGMGEVYRARDTRLDRTVAIKILNSSVVSTSESRARFVREARVISQLQHPHICVLHDVGQDGSTDYLVMEFLEGESLASRLFRGPLPTQELLKVGIEIADALGKAHRAGVVHRDLKPGNVMLTKSGAKLLDFGLAKPHGVPLTPGSGPRSVLAAAITQTAPGHTPATPPMPPISSAGEVVGTVQYMSPEQIQGLEADARSDIFALGLVLFEMATGKHAFEGKTQASIVGQILAVNPPSASSIRRGVPLGLDRIIRICLEKDPDERFQTAHDLKLELQRIAEGTTATEPATTPSRTRWLPWAVAGLLAILVLAFAAGYFLTVRSPQSSIHSRILAPDNSEFDLASTNGVISPDGSRIAYVARKSGTLDDLLFVQPLGSSMAQPLPGTEGAKFPFWSFDSRYVGFFVNDKLAKVSASGGPPQVLCDASGGRGGTWNQDDVILFAPSSTQGLFRIPASGGVPAVVTELTAVNGALSHRWPFFLPDGKHFLFLLQSSDKTSGGIYVGSLDSKQYKLLVHSVSSAAYAEPGYLLFVRDTTLMAQKLDTRTLKLEGDALPVANISVNAPVLESLFSASKNGTLVYVTGAESGGTHLNWYGRDGKLIAPVLPDVAFYDYPAISPDGKRLAVSISVGANEDIWLIDLQRQTKSRLTFGPGRSFLPLWSPDGRWIYYSANPAGQNHIYRRPSDGTGNPEPVLVTEGIVEIASAISGDGKYLAYQRLDPKSPGNNFDVYILPLFGDRKPIAEVASAFNEVGGRFSPNGKWLAYNSTESGQQEVYIKAFPGPGGKYQVSNGGAAYGQWSADGRELFLVSRASAIMAVDVRENGSALDLGTPHEILRTAMVAPNLGPYALTPDGKKFVVNEVGERKEIVPLTLVTNWTVDIKK